MMSVNFGPVVTPRMGMRMRPGFRAPQRPRPSGGLDMAQLSIGGLPHDAPMSYVSRVDALHGMPMHTLPDYMMSRMAEGGDVDPFEMPMRGVANRRALERHIEGYRPRLRSEMEPLDTLEQMLERLPVRDQDRMWSLPPDAQERLMGGIEGRYVDDLRGSAQMHIDDKGYRQLGSWDPQGGQTSLGAQSRPREARAMGELWNAGQLRRLSDNENQNTIQGIVGSLIDPTQWPLYGAGIAGRVAPKLPGIAGRVAPKIFRPMPMRMPLKARAGEFGAWNYSGPNIGGASSDSESDYDVPWGMSSPPSDLRIGP